MWEGEVRWGLVGTGPRLETQIDGRVNQMEGFRVEGLSSTSMDASNDGLSMVGTPDSA